MKNRLREWWLDLVVPEGSQEEVVALVQELLKSLRHPGIVTKVEERAAATGTVQVTMIYKLVDGSDPNVFLHAVREAIATHGAAVLDWEDLGDIPGGASGSSSRFITRRFALRLLKVAEQLIEKARWQMYH